MGRGRVNSLPPSVKMFGLDALAGKQKRDGSLSDAVPGDVSDSDTEL